MTNRKYQLKDRQTLNASYSIDFQKDNFCSAISMLLVGKNIAFRV